MAGKGIRANNGAADTRRLVMANVFVKYRLVAFKSGIGEVLRGVWDGETVCTKIALFNSPDSRIPSHQIHVQTIFLRFRTNSKFMMGTALITVSCRPFSRDCDTCRKVC